MSRATDHSSEHHPWTRPDLLPHAVASAGWGERYPALRYKDSDLPEERLIPRDVIQDVVLHEQFAVVVWQGTRLSMIRVSHIPGRTFALDEIPERSDDDWATIRYYAQTRGGAMFTAMEQHLDPRDIMLSLCTVLETPMGFTPGDEQDIVEPDQAINRVLIEFPDFREKRELPLSIVISVLGGVATQEYLDAMRYGLSEV